MSHFNIAGTRSGRIVARTPVFLVVLALSLLVQTGFAQDTPPLKFGNNYFVTGDYVVGGVGLKGLGDASGYAKRNINIPDTTYGPSAGVPDGADVVAAFLYWQTVDFNGSRTGQKGFFRGKPIVGVSLGNPATPVSWSNGGCAGESGGNKTIVTYRADVRDYLPIDPITGRTQVGNSQTPVAYEVRLADSGSNGNTVPFTLGATLVIIYRVLDNSVALNSIIIYDGSYAPSNASPTMTQTMQGFYQPTQLPGSPVAKLTHIVGNGQSNKTEQVSFHGMVITPSGVAAFPGVYGSWDNPTYDVSHYVNPADTTETTTVANGKCVSWGAVVFSTTVQDGNNDGLLDVWKQNQGYCDPTDTSGSCDKTHASWVDLTGAHAPGTGKDIFIQADYMCSNVIKGMCDTSPGQHSHRPDPQAVTNIVNAFANHGITLHIQFKNAIQEQTCTDSPPQFCSFPDVPGVVGWKSGFGYLQYLQPLNPNDPICANTGVCQRRFQFGQKDSFHYVIFGHALAVPKWRLQDGTLVSITDPGTGLTTFTTSAAHKLKTGDRITISDAITNPILNGIYFVTYVSDTVFTIQASNPTATHYAYDKSSDPHFGVASGNVGTGSGFSDVGGANSLITLGLWGADGQKLSAVSGTFMHELGHNLALTHGGSWRQPGSYALTFEPNCKPNFQSVMNYLFQVDLLGPDPGVLEYSDQELGTVDEMLAGSVTKLQTTDLPPKTAAYPTTQWYALVQPGQIGASPASAHCDGTPKLPNDPAMYRVDGSITSISPAWSDNQDVNFDGVLNSSTNAASPPLHGYKDWLHLDLRQIGATSNDFMGGGGTPSVGGGTPSVGGGTPSVGGGTPSVGGGVGELDVTTYYSAGHPPRPPFTAALTSSGTVLNWTASTASQVYYKIYRDVGSGPVLIGTVPSGSTPDSPPPTTPALTTFTDPFTLTSCGTITYSVSAFASKVLAPPEGLESGALNVVLPVTCPVTATLTASNKTYDGTNTEPNASMSCSLSGVLAADIGKVSCVASSGTFDGVNAGAHTVTATVTLSGPNAGNYTFGAAGTTVNSTSAHAPASITPKTLTASIIGNPTKTYNGDAIATLTAANYSLFGLVGTESFTVTKTSGTYNSANVASATTVTASLASTDFTPAGTLAINYNSPTTASGPGHITKANALITVTPYSVIYDGKPHTATGTAKGVESPTPANLNSGLDLSHTTHTNAGIYSSDYWTFMDTTNYNNVGNTTITDKIQDFSISVSPSQPQTVSSGLGQPATYMVTVTPLGGLTGMVSLTCSGGPPGAACSISPNTVTLTGAGSQQSFQVILNTSRNTQHGTWYLVFTGNYPGLCSGATCLASHSTQPVQLTIK